MTFKKLVDNTDCLFRYREVNENKRVQVIDEHLDRVFACLDAVRISINKKKYKNYMLLRSI